jgi:hypothetical protein
MDFGSGGAAMGVNLSSASLVVGGGKDGQLYLLNGGNLGGSGGYKCRATLLRRRRHLFDRSLQE